MNTDPLIGHHFGPYKIIEKIARGGMGEVYKGFHSALDRHVAIKLLGPSFKADPALTQRFQREAKAAAALRHPNIIQVFDFGIQDDAYYLVMEYVEGTDLRSEMDRRQREGRPFTPSEIIHLLGQVGDALDYAHQRGVIHRDVKPANILVTREGQAILSDFGLVMLRDRASQATLGHSFGTPEYIAPEQAIDSRAAVPESDIYSLGGILYEMVTGRLPFEAESSISLALKHISEEPTPPRQYVPTLPPAIESVMLRALAKEPSARFATAQEMVDALRIAWDVSASSVARAAAQLASAPAMPPAAPVSQPAPQAMMAAPPVPERSAQPAIVAQLPIVDTPKPSAIKEPEAVSSAPGKVRPQAIWIAVLAVLLLAVVGVLALNRGGAPAVAMATATATRISNPIASPSRPQFTPTPTLIPPPAAGQVLTRTPDHMAMRFIPAGTFLMGTSDKNAPDREKPQHTVTLSSFWIDETEVTNEQYKLCVEAGSCAAPVIRTAYDDSGRADHPVTLVNWEEANTYCRWLAGETGWDVHLPTEAQWEKAASWDPSTQAKRRYPWGDKDPSPRLLNFDGSGLNRTVPAGSYPDGASAYGVLDMAGNVWEWVADWYSEYDDDIPEQPVVDPTGLGVGNARVVRGGSYGYGGSEARSTYRNLSDPQKAKGYDLGFRCAVNGERLP